MDLIGAHYGVRLMDFHVELEIVDARMIMNNPDLIALSKAAAKVAGVPAYEEIESGMDVGMGLPTRYWLHEDSARCFDMSLWMQRISQYEGEVDVFWNVDYPRITERFSDHNNSREQATRVAILKAIVAIGEQQ